MTISLIFEILVSMLLMVTIAYCFSLDKKLKALRSGQDGVRQSITELVKATLHAEHVLAGLKETGDEAGTQLQGQIEEARGLVRNLDQKTTRQHAAPNSSGTANASGSLMDRLKKAS